MSTAGPTRLLTIAGSDSGGGAGIQADLKTFAAHGVYGMSVLTAVTAQNTQAVTAVLALEPDLVRAQLDAVLGDLGVDGIKIGMLANAQVVRAVAAGLRVGVPQGVPVVVDPVMVAKSGDALLEDEAITALQEELLPLATVLTPNLPEAERLTGGNAATESGREAMAEQLSQSGTAVLLKGGHGEGQQLVDLLREPTGQVHRFQHPRLQTTSTHGTGCTLSAAIAARLARGDNLPQAAEGAIQYLHGAIRAAQSLGSGHGPVNHLYRLFS